MIDHAAALLALRNRALRLVVCVTDPVTPPQLGTSAIGYTRDVGSFVTDGFLPGMEVVPANFVDTSPSVISAVSDTLLTIVGGRTVEAAAPGRSLTVGLPVATAWENVELIPIAGRPYLEEGFVPATHAVITMPLTSGTAKETGLYILRWYGLSGYGSSAIRKAVDALAKLFTPGTTLAAGADTVRVRGDVGLIQSALIPQSGGWTAATISVPWQAYSTNAVAP